MASWEASVWRGDYVSVHMSQDRRMLWGCGDWDTVLRDAVAWGEGEATGTSITWGLGARTPVLVPVLHGSQGAFHDTHPNRFFSLSSTGSPLLLQ